MAAFTYLIGMSGRARHGKTETVDALARAANDSFGSANAAIVYDIGDMIRRMCISSGRLPEVARVDMTREQLQILIDVGKEMRAVDANYWIKRLLAQVENDKPWVALCPNIRLPQEAQAVHDKGGVIVRCTRLNKDGSLYISPDRDPNDITETALQFWPADYYLTHVTSADAKLVKAQAVTLFKHIAERI